MSPQEVCEATTGQRDLAWAIIHRGLGPEQPQGYRCQLPAGHSGQHRHTYCPFPGFADEVLRWDDLTADRRL